MNLLDNATLKRQFEWTLAALGVSAFVLVVSGIGAVRASRHAAQVPPSADASAALLVRLGDVKSAVAGYLQSHDLRYLKQLESNGKEVNASVRALSSMAGTARVAETLLDHLRAVTVALLQNETSAQDALGTFLQRADTVRDFLEGKLESAINPNQPEALARRTAVLTAERESASYTQALILYAKTRDADALSDAQASWTHLEKAIADYERATKSRRTTVWLDQLREQLTRWHDAGQMLATMEGHRDPLIQAYESALDDLRRWLAETSAPAPAAPVKRPSRPWFCIIGLVLGAAGAGAAIARMLWLLRRRVFDPLAHLSAQLEAAATGDLTREYRARDWDEIGKLGTAANRLVSVLARSENLVYHLATLVESSGEAIIGYTLEGTILSWNKGAQRVYGYSPEEIKGACITVLSPRDSGAELRRMLERLRNGEKVNAFEMIQEGKQGRVIHAFIRVATILDSTKKVIGASMCVQDVTPTDAASAARHARYSSFTG